MIRKCDKEGIYIRHTYRCPIRILAWVRNQMKPAKQDNYDAEMKWDICKTAQTAP